MLLAQAWRDRRNGRLELERDAHAAFALEFVDGAPASVVTTRGDEYFARFLEITGRVTGPQRAEIERMAQERDCPEASAVLALKHLDPKALYQAMREHQRARIAESFEWAKGDYRWDTATPAADDAKRPKPFDVLSLFR